MARTVTLNGQNFSVPEPGDKGYDQALTDYLVALATAIGFAAGATTPTGVIDGVNAAFTLSARPLGTLILVVDRLVQVPGIDFTISGTAVTFLAGSIPPVGAILRAYF